MNDDVTPLLTRQVHDAEPPFTLDPATAMTRGQQMRAARRRRHVVLAVVGVLVACVGVAGTLRALDIGRDPEFASSRVPSSYVAEDMPQVLRQVARDGLGSSLQGLQEKFKAKGDNTVLTSGDYDQASSMELSYSDGTEHHLSIYVAHARSEAEGDPDKVCDGLRTSSWATAIPECAVTHINGYPVITRVTIGSPLSPRPGNRLWEMLPLASAEAVTNQGPDLYFTRTVKVIRSDTLVTSVREVVHASTLEEAEALFMWSADKLTAVAGDPRLAMARPTVTPTLEPARKAP